MPETPDSGPEPPHVVRVGGIDYLNARPLLYGLEADGPEAGVQPALDLVAQTPSRMARSLRDGDLDVALVPVVAYPDRSDYWIVPGICIASYGSVQSIRIYHRRPLDEVETVALDASSRTSAALARLLLREVWGAAPRFVDESPATLRDRLSSSGDEPPDFDACLLIGDWALTCPRIGGWESVDLGTAWTRWTGLPLVYAFWVCRLPGGPGSMPEGLADRLARASRDGRTRIDEIVDVGPLPAGMDASQGRHYLNRVIQYDLGPAELEGLELFFRRLRETGILPGDGTGLRFLPGDGG